MKHQRAGKDAGTDAESNSTQVLGTVEMVNPDARFVVVKLGSNLSMQPGSDLFTIGEDGRRAKLKITPERKGVFVTADVIEGDPRQGDAVLSTAATESPQTTPQPGPDARVGDRPTISISPGSVTQPPL